MGPPGRVLHRASDTFCFRMVPKRCIGTGRSVGPVHATDSRDKQGPDRGDSSGVPIVAPGMVPHNVVLFHVKRQVRGSPASPPGLPAQDPVAVRWCGLHADVERPLRLAIDRDVHEHGAPQDPRSGILTREALRSVSRETVSMWGVRVHSAPSLDGDLHGCAPASVGGRLGLTLVRHHEFSPSPGTGAIGRTPRIRRSRLTF